MSIGWSRETQSRKRLWACNASNWTSPTLSYPLIIARWTLWALVKYSTCLVYKGKITPSKSQIETNFSAKNDDKKKKKTEKSSGINLVNELGELWEEREYDEEFKVNEFLEKLKN